MVHVDKLRNLVLAVAAHPEVKNLGVTKLWKLIYFADVTALRQHGTTITGSEFIKYPHGPVPSRGEKVLRAMQRDGAVSTEQRPIGRFMQTCIEGTALADMDVFSHDERNVIDKVCRELGSETAQALSKLSHDEPAWVAASELDKLEPQLMHYGRSEDPEGL